MSYFRVGYSVREAGGNQSIVGQNMWPFPLCRVRCRIIARRLTQAYLTPPLRALIRWRKYRKRPRFFFSLACAHLRKPNSAHQGLPHVGGVAPPLPTLAGLDVGPGRCSYSSPFACVALGTTRTIHAWEVHGFGLLTGSLSQGESAFSNSKHTVL